MDGFPSRSGDTPVCQCGLLSHSTSLCARKRHGSSCEPSASRWWHGLAASFSALRYPIHSTAAACFASARTNTWSSCAPVSLLRGFGPTTGGSQVCSRRIHSACRSAPQPMALNPGGRIGSPAGHRLLSPTAPTRHDHAAIAERIPAGVRCRAQTITTGTARAWPSAIVVPAGTTKPGGAPGTSTTASPHDRRKPCVIVSSRSGTTGLLAVVMHSLHAHP